MSESVKKPVKAARGAKKPAEGPFVRVTLVRSLIGYPPEQRQTARGLGLRKPQSSAVLVDTPAVRGMIRKIVHALKVEAVEKP